MRPGPIVSIVDAREISARRARRSPHRRVRGLALGSIVTGSLLLLVIAPASAATVDRSWRAKVGSAGANGAVTVVAYTSGTGATTLRLTSLPASTPVAVTLRAGTCARPATVAATWTTARTSAAGAISATRSLPSSAVSRLRAAGSLVATIRAGAVSRCAVLARLAVATPSTPSTPPPSPPAGTAGLDVRAAGFAFTPTSLTVDAGLPFSVTFRNDDAGVTHGFNVGASTTAAPDYTASTIAGTAGETFVVPGLSAGTYVFYCPIHPSMKGTLTVRGAGSASTPSPVSSASASPVATSTPTAAPPTPPAAPTPYPTYLTY